MTWWAWTIVGLACWVVVCLLLVVAWIATIEWHRRKRDPKTPAGGEPPNPRGVRSPLPGHRHDHRGLDMTIKLWRCGCIHFINRRGAITDAWPCVPPPPDWDAWAATLTEGES